MISRVYFVFSLVGYCKCRIVLTATHSEEYNQSIFFHFMNTSRSSSPLESQENGGFDYFTLEEAARELDLSTGELAQFLFYFVRHIQIYMSFDGNRPVESGFYGPAELTGVYRPNVRLLKCEIRQIKEQEAEKILEFRKKRLLEAEKPTGRIEKISERLRVFAGKLFH